MAGDPNDGVSSLWNTFYFVGTVLLAILIVATA